MKNSKLFVFKLQNENDDDKEQISFKFLLSEIFTVSSFFFKIGRESESK